MPTFPSTNYKATTAYGDWFIKLPTDDSPSRDEFLKRYQADIDGRFKNESGGTPVKISEVYICDSSGNVIKKL